MDKIVNPLKRFLAKHIFRNTSYLYMSQIIGKLLYLSLLALMSKYFGIKGVGQYASTFAIVGMFFIC